MTQQEYEVARKACILNAKRFVRATKKLKGAPTRHIRYHLAMLALEEVGKIEILNLTYAAADSVSEDRQPNYKDDDHEKKLFFGFRAVSLGTKLLTKELDQEQRWLARTIHQKRLTTLYTDVKNPTDPARVLTESEVDNILQMADVRIKMVEHEGVQDRTKKLPKKQEEELTWFLRASDDPTEKPFIFGGQSNQKLVELGNTKKWVKWHYAEHLKRQEESKNILKTEIERKTPGGLEGNAPKWRLKKRLYSMSHSIRNKPLAKINKGLDGFQFYQGKTKNELIIETIHPKKLKIANLWDSSRSLQVLMKVALNVGSCGMILDQKPYDRDIFYDELKDVDNPQHIPVLKQQRQGAMKWNEQGAVLSEADMGRTLRFFSFTIDNDSYSKFREGISEYNAALVLFEKSDINLNLDVQSMGKFRNALKSISVAFGDVSDADQFQDQILDSIDEDFHEPFKELSQALDSIPPTAVTEEYVYMMKLIVDTYLNRKSSEWAKARVEKDRKDKQSSKQ